VPRVTRLARAAVLTLFVPAALAAQAPDVRNVATDPDVLGQQRLFSAWIEGQIAYRGLPGIVVGVVADQELVWAQGFGFADVAARKPRSAWRRTASSSPRRRSCSCASRASSGSTIPS
jgi:CubicO group peptidase (beta-lactamase class C family)